jgi:hypothetical protein
VLIDSLISVTHYVSVLLIAVHVHPVDVGLEPDEAVVRLFVNARCVVFGIGIEGPLNKMIRPILFTHEADYICIRLYVCMNCLHTCWVDISIAVLIANGDCMSLRNRDRLYFCMNLIVIDILPVLTAISIVTSKHRRMILFSDKRK